MALLQVEAEKLALPMLQQGVIETIITSDQMYQVLPFEPISGTNKTYNRENTLGDAEFYDVNDTLGESAASFTKKEQALRRIIGQVDVDEFLQNTMSPQNDQTAIQIAKKSKVVGRKFADKAVMGSTQVNSKEFDGVLRLANANDSSQRINGGKAALGFSMLDELIDQVKMGDNPVFVFNSRTLRSYAALQRALGGTLPETVSIGGKTFTTYRGVPILKNDYLSIQQDEFGNAREWAVNWAAGVVRTLGDIVLAVATPQAAKMFVCTTAGTSHATTEPTWDTTVGNPTTDGTAVFTCRESKYTSPMLVTMDEMEGFTGMMAANQAGIEVVPVGPVQDKDAMRWRVRWYVAVRLNSTLALAQVYGVNN